MIKLSIISHFYNHIEKVNEQLARWSQLPAQILSMVEFILVDDFSDTEFVPPVTPLNLRCFKVDTDIDWNQAGCRNLGVLNARGEWSLLFDIDQKLTPAAVPVILANLDRLDPSTLHYLRAEDSYDDINKVTSEFHVNSFLVNTSKFKTIGLYDEDFTGHYGYEDLYLPYMWEKNGGLKTLLREPFFFEGNLNFRTESLNRDLERNAALGNQKVALLAQHQGPGAVRPTHLLRFQWHELNKK